MVIESISWSVAFCLLFSWSSKGLLCQLTLTPGGTFLFACRRCQIQHDRITLLSSVFLEIKALLLQVRGTESITIPCNSIFVCLERSPHFDTRFTDAAFILLDCIGMISYQSEGVFVPERRSGHIAAGNLVVLHVIRPPQVGPATHTLFVSLKQNGQIRIWAREPRDLRHQLPTHPRPTCDPDAPHPQPNPTNLPPFTLIGFGQVMWL